MFKALLAKIRALLTNDPGISITITTDDDGNLIRVVRGLDGSAYAELMETKEYPNGYFSIHPVPGSRYHYP